MIITTSYKPDASMLEQVNILAEKLQIQYVQRDHRSINSLMSEYNVTEIIVVENAKTKYYSEEADQPFYFHPSMAILRINSLKQGDNDLMVQISDLKPGDSFLDCTLGLASDSLVASYIVGEKGQVVGFESQLIISTLVEEGLKNGWPKDMDIDHAMKNIKVVNIDYLQGLKSLADNSFDIVYFDPMFRRGLKKSSSINPLRTIANYQPISPEAILEAKRVARKKVILKENRKSNEFERLGFRAVSRSSSVTYGVISVNGDE